MATKIRRSGVRRVPLSEIQNDLSRFVREAEARCRPPRGRSVGNRLPRGTKGQSAAVRTVWSISGRTTDG
jgi:hypothetical protein